MTERHDLAVLGPHVTDLIPEVALAARVGRRPTTWPGRPMPIPTLPEAMLEAALGFRDATIHFRRR